MATPASLASGWPYKLRESGAAEALALRRENPGLLLQWCNSQSLAHSARLSLFMPAVSQPCHYGCCNSVMLGWPYLCHEEPSLMALNLEVPARNSSRFFWVFNLQGLDRLV
mmetsp:Transcript_538/g.1221  ORF Transcript_538/g.1221 Transcript_538/m.1221 type:complete len:111 (+) Transcript_538:121-453(+)